jgi:hypothetical protein
MQMQQKSDRNLKYVMQSKIEKIKRILSLVAKIGNLNIFAQ